MKPFFAAIAAAILIGSSIAAAENEESILRRQVEGLQREGEYQAAIATIQKGRRDLGKGRFLSWKLAELHLLDEDYPKAVEAYLLNLRHEPRRYAQVEGILQSLARKGQADQVIQLLKAAAEKSEDPLPAALLASSCALEAGDPGIGFEVLGRIVSRPEVPDLLFQFASRCEAKGHDPVASRAYAIFADHSPNSPYIYQALLRRARIEARLGNLDQAIAACRRLAGEFPERPEAMEALLELGKLQMGAGNDLDAAGTSLRTLLESAPQRHLRAEALSLLSECALRRDDFVEAAARLEQLRRMDPSFAYEAGYKLAELSYFKHDFDAAVEILNPLLQENHREDLANDALQLLLRIERHQGQAEALGMLARAQLRERQRRPAEAAAAWAWLETRAPEVLRQLSMLVHARIRAARQQPEAALNLYARMISTYPQSPYILDAQIDRARIYLEQNQVDHALKVFETALMSFPEDARIPEIRLQVQRLRRWQEERKTG